MPTASRSETLAFQDPDFCRIVELAKAMKRDGNGAAASELLRKGYDGLTEGNITALLNGRITPEKLLALKARKHTRLQAIADAKERATRYLDEALF